MPKLKSRKVVAQPSHDHELAQKPTITHEEEKLLWFSFSLEALLCGLCFDKRFCEVVSDFIYCGIQFSLVQPHGLCFDERVMLHKVVSNFVYRGIHFSLVQLYGLCFDEWVMLHKVVSDLYTAVYVFTSPTIWFMFRWTCAQSRIRFYTAVYIFHQSSHPPPVSGFSDSTLRKTWKVIQKWWNLWALRDIEHVALSLRPIPNSFPVVRFTFTNLFYHLKVVTNKTKRNRTVLKLVIVKNKFVQLT